MDATVSTMIPLNRTYLLGLIVLVPFIVLAQKEPIAAPKSLRFGAAPLASPAEAGSAVPLRAREFPLSAVKLLDGPFRRAMETNKAYLLRLDPDRLLAGFRRE